MSSLSQSSLSSPVHDCTVTSLDFDLQEKFLLLHTVELSSKSIDTWMQELSESEIQNANLRKKILEREKQIKELSSMLQCEKINIQKGDCLSKSVKEVQAHLQCQIERQEAENDELKVKIQTLENKIAEWKHQIGEYKCQKLALKETREQKKIALKKALRSQKQRAQHLEEAVKDVTSKIREHEVKLCEILSTSDAWKKQHDRIVEEKKMLEVQIENLEKEFLACLSSQIRGLMEDMERREERRRNSEAEILGKLNSVNSENKNLYLENKKLKASLATLEKSTVCVECELLQLQEKAKLQENLLEQRKNEYERRKSYYITYQRVASALLQVHIVCTELCEAHLKLIEANNCKLALARFASKKQDLANACEKYMFSQVQKRQIAVEELKSRYVTVLNENRKITENKYLEADKVRNKTEAELKELEHVCDLLKAAEENQQKLLSWERILAQKCKTLRELELQDNHSVTSVGNLCLEKENCNIQKIYEALQRQLGEVEYQNEELAYQLRKEDESLQSSKLQLEEKIAEYNALTRQLESALEEGRKMVAEEQEKMSYKEQAFQTKLLLLEAEVRKRQEEKKQLLCLFHHNEKHHEVHLKELENSLQKSENKNQSIQNYVQFLKDAYVTMFG